MIIHEITFYRRTMNGWEFRENLLFLSRLEALKILFIQGFKLMQDEENLYSNNSARATLIEREVE